jgi:glycosyltransferase involved in cell wall biosynthesis
MADLSGQPRSLNILFVIKSIALAGGGAERVLADLTAVLVNRGHSITVGTFDELRRKPFYDFDPRVRIEPLATGNVAETTSLGFLRAARRLKGLVGRERPDVVVGFLPSAYGRLASAVWRIPVVASEHTAFAHFRRNPVQALLVRAVSPLCAAFTVPSEQVRSGFPASIARKMVAIPNPVAVPLAPSATGQGLRRVILSVGGLRPEKNHLTLLAAFATLAERFPDWALRIVGDGPLRPTLEGFVRDKGLAGRIQLPGAVNQIAAEYESAQAFAMPSLYESFGLATAEALAHGLPAVGFADCPGTNELIENEVNGLLVPAGDRVVGLAAALGRLLDNPDLRRRLGEAGPPSVARFSVDAIVDQWEELLGRVARYSRG